MEELKMEDKNILTSDLLFEQLKEFEGLRLKAYQDAAGVWTIGYGHTHNVRLRTYAQCAQRRRNQ